MTSNITFEKQGDVWVSEFTINADTNLHIEKKSAGTLKVYQRTAGTEYALVNMLMKHSGKANDLDLVGAIYPKDIKVVSPAEVIVGILTTM